jgi:hypothetical protein
LILEIVTRRPQTDSIARPDVAQRPEKPVAMARQRNVSRFAR